MKRTRHNLVTIEKTDQMADLPEHWEKNNEAIENALDMLQNEIVKLEGEIECLKRRRLFSP